MLSFANNSIYSSKTFEGKSGKGGVISKFFTLAFPEKVCQITMLNFSTESEKVKDSDLLHILGNDQSEKLSPLRQPCFSILTTRNLESKFKLRLKNFVSRSTDL